MKPKSPKSPKSPKRTGPRIQASLRAVAETALERACAARSALRKPAGLALLLTAGLACGRTAIERGSFSPNPSWPEGTSRPGSPASPRGAARVGAVVILEGDDTLVSGLSGALGLRIDEERNDLARVAERFEAVAPLAHDATLVLFTTFDDLGAAGRAYSVPVRSTARGLGKDDLDQRDVFSVERIVQIVNMKRLDAHPREALAATFAHELAHRYLASMSARLEGASKVLPLAGRQGAHWRADLHTFGSLLGGYGWMETTPGNFLVVEAEARFSTLDLYGLGLAAPSEVAPFFWIEGARARSGAPLPIDAQLPIDARATGRRVDLRIDDIVRALGPRTPAREEATHVALALLTAPTETASTASVVEVAARIDGLRVELAREYAGFTQGRGQLVTD